MRRALIYLTAYILLDWASYLHPVLPLAVTPWNPTPGLSLAFLLLAGWRQWPWLVLAGLAAELLLRDIPLGLAWQVAAVAMPACAYAGLAWLLQVWLKLAPRPGTPRELTWFVAGSLAAALCAGLGYVGVYTAAGVAAPGDFPENLLRFWIGHATGLLVAAPLILFWADWRLGRAAPRREAWVQGAGLLVALWLVFGLPFTDEFKFFHVLYLPMVWIAARHGIVGVALALAVSQLGVIAALQWNGHHATTVMEIQLLLLALAVTSLFLGVTVSAGRQAEERLHRRDADLNQALRLAAAGEMAQAIAHELNQPLTALANYSRVGRALLDAPERAPLLPETLEKIEREATRAGHVVRRLREFFQGGGLRLETTRVEDLVEEGLAPARRRAERLGVELRVAVAAELPGLRVDRVQIGMVLHNLVSNALDAVAPGAAGEARPWVAIDAGLADARQVRIRVSDSGPGIAAEMRERLFQSFATSKPEGMGLGLSIGRTLVQAHGGELWLEGERPTRFCFTLPLLQDAA
jgi:signal transduction histidine kinase